MDDSGLLVEPVAVIAARVSFHTELSEALTGAALVQDCAPENIELKRALFAEFSLLSEPDAVLASSSSALVPSSFAANLESKDRVIVGHPGNPPYLLPIREVVPAPFTAPATTDRAAALYGRAGLKVRWDTRSKDSSSNASRVHSCARPISGLYLLSTPVDVGWSSFTVALGRAEVVPVFGWASWPVKEIVAPGLSS